MASLYSNRKFSHVLGAQRGSSFKYTYYVMAGKGEANFGFLSKGRTNVIFSWWRWESENIFLELKLKNRSWGISCIYRPPSMNDKTSETDICSKLDQILINYEHMCIVGDLNYNLLVSEKSHTLRNIIDSYSLKNLIQDPTCHTKFSQPSLTDVFLTNSPVYWMTSTST